ncbi:MAG: hypothetical protein DMD38_00010 [Gemmatimonadetes bacterium]|nr:MAG: hypothetical protein DMD38_00010 [Gemmatimonadota bacterium]
MPIEGQSDDVPRVSGLLRAHPAMRQEATTGCLDEDALAALVSGTAGERRAAFLEHLAACARCRHAVAALSRVADDLTYQLEGPPARRWTRRVVWTTGLAAAAGLALFLVWPRGVSEPAVPPDYREPAITTAGAPNVIAPRGRVASVSSLTWTHVPRAVRYRLRLFDNAGAVLWEGEVTDTSAVLPPTVRLAPGAAYFWKVEAKTGWQRWVASDLVEFRIGRSGP